MNPHQEARPSEPDQRFRIIERVAGMQAEIAHVQTQLADLLLEMGRMIRDLSAQGREPVALGIDFGADDRATVVSMKDGKLSLVPPDEVAQLLEGAGASPVVASGTLGEPLPGDIPTYAVAGLTVHGPGGDIEITRPIARALTLLRDGRFREAWAICQAAEIPHVDALTRSFETVKPQLAAIGIHLVEGRKGLWAVRRVAA